MSYKSDFPIFKNNKNLVYLDSAATSQKPKIVIDSISQFYSEYNSNVRRGLYPIAEKATAKVEEVRAKVAKFINAKDPKEIIFVRNATEALNLLAYSASHNLSPSETIATTITEHHSNFVPWQVLSAKTGCNLQIIDIGENFQLKKVPKNSKLLTMAHTSNVLGTTNNIEQISKDFKNSSNFFIVDAAQSVPHQKIDVQKLGCDFFVFSGHKMMAATGIGILYGKKEKLKELEPFLYGGEMIREVSVESTTFEEAPYKFEAGTPDIAGIISLGAAIDYLNSIGMDKVRNYEAGIIKYAMERLENVGNIEIYGPKNPTERSSVISFNLNGVHSHDVAQILGDMNICIRSGHHCAMPLHQRLGIQASARVSFAIYNDEEDIDTFIQGLEKVKKIFKYLLAAGVFKSTIFADSVSASWHVP